MQYDRNHPLAGRKGPLAGGLQRNGRAGFAPHEYHGIRQALLRAGVSQDNSAAWTSVLLVFLSALLTGFGFYQKLAKHGGAGTLVPITGFANAVASAAVEAKTEGFILGVGTKIFTIAGPVILYGTAASVIYGLIYYFSGIILR